MSMGLRTLEEQGGQRKSGDQLQGKVFLLYIREGEIGILFQMASNALLTEEK